MSSPMMSPKEVASIMNCSVRHGYTIIRTLNAELAAKGFFTMAGRVPRKYFYERVGLDKENFINSCTIEELDEKIPR